MAIGWLTVLQAVPWGQVISNAPKVADGAKKLWNAVAKNSPSDRGATPVSDSRPGDERDALARLQAKTSALEAAVADLHEQMLASSELIKALAEQNTQLVQRIEANRVKLLWLASITGGLSVILIVTLVLILVR